MPLALLLLGGAVVVAIAASTGKKSASGSSGRASVIGTGRSLPQAKGNGGILLTIPVAASAEKFIDPHFSDCWTRDGGGVEGHRGDGGYEKAILSQGFRELYDMKGDQSVGLEYLGGVPNNAAARVAAMRKKINDNATNDTLKYRYAKQQDLSADGLMRLTIKIVESLNSPSKAKALGESLGLPIAEAESLRNDIVALLDKPEGQIVEILWSTFSPQITTLVRQAISEATGAASGGASALGSAAAALPILSAMFNSVMVIWADRDKDIAEHKKAACAAAGAILDRAQARVAEAGLPSAWHVLDLNASCDDIDGSEYLYEKMWPTSLKLAMSTTVKNELYQMGVRESEKGSKAYGEVDESPLPALDQIALRRWWALASLLWSNEAVGSVMRTMGSDYWGGELASDEQVMLIAAPIATAYGLDVDDFARKLWNVSKGWRSRPELFVKVDAGGGCGAIVDNARYIQFAVLARDAFALAEASKGAGGGAGVGGILSTSRCNGRGC